MTLGFLITFYILYGLSSYLSEYIPWRTSVAFAWEKQIPFLPWTAIIYLSMSLLILLPLFIIRDKALIWQLIKILSIQTLIGSITFILFPVENDFPARQGAGFFYQIFILADTLNLTGNNQPSLHVCFAVTIAMVLVSRVTIKYQIFYYLWALAITISTMTIHEHGLVDIIFGFFLALWGAKKWMRMAGIPYSLDAVKENQEISAR